MALRSKTGWRRLAAFWIDWLVIAGWGVGLFGVVMILSGGQPQAPQSPWIGEAIGFISMTIPVVLYFAIFERSAWHGTIGKRAMGLFVASTGPRPVSFRQTLIRNSIKFAPWEAGHLVAQQAMFSSDDPALWIWIFAVGSMIGPLWWIIGVFFSEQTMYDRVAGTIVQYE